MMALSSYCKSMQSSCVCQVDDRKVRSKLAKGWNGDSEVLHTVHISISKRAVESVDLAVYVRSWSMYLY